MSFDTLVAPLRADVSNGASVVARAAADVVRRATAEIEAGSLEELRGLAAELTGAILDAQPSMAPLVTLAARVLSAVDEADAVDAGLEEVARVAREFLDDLEARKEEAARQGAGALGDVGSVFTLSASSTVIRALQARAARGALHVTCLESRPGNEGRDAAHRLTEAGASVVFAVDAAMGTLLPGCDAVVLGSDSVGDRGVVNKIGSRPAALLARESEVPVYVLTDGTKLLPPGFPQPTNDDRPPTEVWDVSQEIRIWNRYFEAFPTEWATRVITESGPRTPRQVEEARSGLPVPAALRRWAREREAATTTA